MLQYMIVTCSKMCNVDAVLTTVMLRLMFFLEKFTQYAGFTTLVPLASKIKNINFPTLGRHRLDKYSISHCICHTFFLSVGTLPPSEAHTSPEPCIHSDNQFVVALRIIVHTKVHALSGNAVWYAVISKSTQTHTDMQYPGSETVDSFPPCHVEMGLS